jgi:hypothetical protein
LELISGVQEFARRVRLDEIVFIVDGDRKEAELPYSYEAVLQQLGARLKAMRKERGWTLQDMVIKHGFHVTHWQHFEKGDRGMSLPSLLRIADVFEVTPSKLLEDLSQNNEKAGR